MINMWGPNQLWVMQLLGGEGLACTWKLTKQTIRSNPVSRISSQSLLQFLTWTPTLTSCASVSVSHINPFLAKFLLLWFYNNTRQNTRTAQDDCVVQLPLYFISKWCCLTAIIDKSANQELNDAWEINKFGGGKWGWTVNHTSYLNSLDCSFFLCKMSTLIMTSRLVWEWHEKRHIWPERRSAPEMLLQPHWIITWHACLFPLDSGNGAAKDGSMVFNQSNLVVTPSTQGWQSFPAIT